MELRIPTSEQLKSVYEEHLKQAFPTSELKPLQSIEELWRDGLYRPWCLFDGDEIVGACFLWLGRRHIYESRFSPEKLDRFIRIPYDPAEPLVVTPWEE